MKHKTLYYHLVAATFAWAASLAWSPMAGADYETAEYKVLESDGAFEVREYPDLMLVATKSQFDAQGRDGSFMKLFFYISGANKSDKKIEMTTPVFMEGDSKNSAVQMGFVMPKEIAKEGVPAPTSKDVDIRKRVGGRFAVLRFPGQLNTKSAKVSEEKLRTWMTSKGLVADDSMESGGVETAGYDPPFTPAPLRRNEILIRLKKVQSLDTQESSTPAIAVPDPQRDPQSANSQINP